VGRKNSQRGCLSNCVLERSASWTGSSSRQFTTKVLASTRRRYVQLLFGEASSDRERGCVASGSWELRKVLSEEWKLGRREFILQQTLQRGTWLFVLRLYGFTRLAPNDFTTLRALRLTTL
jgi:hypothetical protein